MHDIFSKDLTLNTYLALTGIHGIYFYTQYINLQDWYTFSQIIFVV